MAVSNEIKYSAEGESKITIVLTGNTGSGKSAACDFFLQDGYFPYAYPVTITPSPRRKLRIHNMIAHGHMAHGHMPGTVGAPLIGYAIEGAPIVLGPFTQGMAGTCMGNHKIGRKMAKCLVASEILDPSSCTREDELEKLASAILQVPNGIHALGFVISIPSKIADIDVAMLTQLLELVDVIPYTFVLFSHAKRLAKTDIEQKRVIKEMLSDDKCPTILSGVIHKVSHHYMVLESTEFMEGDYQHIKKRELMEIVDSILAETKKPFTCLITGVAKVVQESDINFKMGIVAAKRDLKMLQDQLQEGKQNEDELQRGNKISPRLFWEKWSLWLANCMGKAIDLTPATLGDSALAALVADVSDVDGAGLVANNQLCVIQ